MPPKLPNLKYKPRLVKPKNEPEASTDADNLTVQQLERLRLQQEASAQQQQQQTRPPMSSRDGKGPPTAPLATGAENSTHPKPNVSAKGPSASVSAATITAERAARYLSAEAERFPPNTIWKILQTESENPNMTVYHPTPLDSNLPARLKRGAGDGPVEGDDQRIDATTQDGIMFLKEYEAELSRSHAANARFQRDALQASADRIDFGSAGRQDDGDLVWFQLPRFQSDPPFEWTNLPPGKVGEVKVYKSGRMVMEICGVHYDLAVSGYTAGEDEPCDVLAAVLPPPPAQEENASCYQLGILEKKIICTPSITTD